MRASATGSVRLSPEQVEQNRLDGHDFARCMDFVHARSPSEDAGLYGPQSLTWEMWREPYTLLGGIAAVLLQMAHPSVAAGVSQHSSFRDDVIARARRTTASLYQLIFGTRREALRCSRLLHRVHCNVWGKVEERGAPGEGTEYRANDQKLLRWVAATLIVSGRVSFETFVRPLTDAELLRSYDESLVGAASVGVLPEMMHATHKDFMRWYDDMLVGGELHVGPIARDIAKAIFESPVAQGPFDPLFTAAMLTPAWRDAFELRWTPDHQRRFERRKMALWAARAVLPKPVGYAVAWHQAQARLCRARGESVSLLGRMVDGVGRRVPLPTGLLPERIAQKMGG